MIERARALWRDLWLQHATPERFAAAVFVGTFLGALPLYGIQTVVCLATAQFLRLNKVVVIACSQIAMPPLNFALIGGGIAIGEFVRYGAFRVPDQAEISSFFGNMGVMSELSSLYWSCFLGDAILGTVLGLSFGGAAYYYRVSHPLPKPTPPEPPPAT